MTEFEKRLSDAMSDREQQIEIGPDAWQTHLDLVRAHDSGAGGGSVGLARWRAPALVAASVVAVGLIGGIVAQSGLLGGSPIRPAGDVPAVTASTVLSTTQAGDGPDTGGEHVSRPSDGPAGPTYSRPPSATGKTSASAPERATTRHAPDEAPGVLTTQRPISSSGAREMPPSATTAQVDGIDPPTIGDAAGSGPQATLIDLGALIPCGKSLPDLDTVAPTITVESGPNGEIVNTDKVLGAVLGLGYALVDADGRVASTVGGDPLLQKAPMASLPTGRSAGTGFPTIQPTGLCGVALTSGHDKPDNGASMSEPGKDVASASTDKSLSTAGLPLYRVNIAMTPGTYSAVNVVLVGADLAHAVAYRIGEPWLLAVG